MKRPVRLVAMRACAAAVCCAFAAPAAANPTGPAVVSGQASFQADGKTLNVSNAPGTIIHWQGFSIAQDELTRFLQQSPVSPVMNRVVGGNPSEILGRLSSNGRVFLINPSGIAFGAGSQIDVAGLVASSLNLSDADFLAGRLRFTGSGGEGKVVNRGEIVTPAGGSVYLVAPQVENAGVIRAPSGEIVLAAGSTVRLVDAGFPAIQVEVSAPKDQPLSLGDLASADRGKVFAFLVRQSGVVSASSAGVGDGGKVVLKSAGAVQVAAGSRTEANAAASGDGGEVLVYAEQLAHFAGAIEARGGEKSGDGGDVEVSGKTALAFTGTVDTRAPAGEDGHLLIDPTDITITAAPTGLPANLADGAWLSAEDMGSQSLGAADLASLLDTTSVTLQASRSITLAADVVAAPAAPRTLTLEAPVGMLQGTIVSSAAPVPVNVVARSVAAQPLEINVQQVQAGLQRAASADPDIARLRAQVEAEVARDRERLAQSLQKSCSTPGAVRQGCAVNPPRRLVFGV